MYILKIIHIIQVYTNNIIKVVLFKPIDAFLVTSFAELLIEYQVFEFSLIVELVYLKLSKLQT